MFRRLPIVITAAVLVPGAVAALTVVPTGSASLVAGHTVLDPTLVASRDLLAVDAARGLLQSPGLAAWERFVADQLGEWNAVVDARSGTIEIAEGSGIPWIPGRGNELELADIEAHLRGGSRVDLDTLESLARTFIRSQPHLFGVSTRILELDRGASMPVSDHVWFIEFDVFTLEGIPIEDARVFFRINHGNVVQFGAERVPRAETALPALRLTAQEAENALLTRLKEVEGELWVLEEPRLSAIAAHPDVTRADYDLGHGYALTPVWTIVFAHDAEVETWQARIDARDGRVLELRDLNQYAQVTGGYWPVSWRVDGVQQGQVLTGWPFTTVGGAGGGTTNTSGIYTHGGGTTTARHLGQYVTINDNCTGAPGTASSDANGNITFGTYGPAGPGDCTTQVGVLDNTPSARQQYWHLNKIKEKARAYLTSGTPATWLAANLTANVNIADTCNAFWNGSTVNFYRSGGGCGNTGEDAGVSMHEWGHGMDSNDGSPATAENGTGETYGDFTAALQTLDSCVGQGFLGGNCGGYGNACSQCDGVRDIDWGQHAQNRPWQVEWFTRGLCPCANQVTAGDCNRNYRGPCGINFPLGNTNNKEGHCESYVSSGALFDFAAYDLQQGCSNRNTTQAAYIDYNCAGAAIPSSGNTGTGGPTP